MKISDFRSYRAIAVLVLLIGSLELNAQESSSTELAKKHPPIYFYAPLNRDYFLEKIRKSDKFDSIETDPAGRPISIGFSFAREAKPDNAQIGSAIVSITTLGLTPIRMSNIFSVRMIVAANRTVIFEETYELPRKETTNIWSLKDDSILRDDELQFVDESLQQFLVDLEQDAEVRILFDEYRLYFD